MNHHSENSQRGVASLPTILVLAILILAVGTSIALLGLNSTLTSATQSNGQTALAYAEAGAKDALLKLARNSGYNCSTPNCYSIDMAASGCSTNTACALVSVSSGSPTTITSIGESGTVNRKIVVQATIDSNGKITGYTWSDSSN